MKLTGLLSRAALVGSLALLSCAEDVEEQHDLYESQSLEAWMTQHRPDAVRNFQPAGDSGYYVEVLDEGDPDAEPIGGGDMWVRFDFSARDLTGNIVLTRSASEAKLLNTFTKYTRYVPYYRYCGSANSGMLEGAWLAMRNPLKIVDETGQAREVRLREGSKVRLYLPSLLIGGAGVEGTGGYEGQNALSANRPMIASLEIRDTVDNPLRIEGNDVDVFCKGGQYEAWDPATGSMTRVSFEGNGGLRLYERGEGATESILPDDPDRDADHPYNIAERWVSAHDTIPQLYVNYRFDPTATGSGDRFAYENPYSKRWSYAPYGTSDVDARIAAALKERFHADAEYGGVEKLRAAKTDSVGREGTAKIWYIGRFLDGFIFDTNIDEVKEIVYGSGYSSGSALSYTPSEGGLIDAFYHVVPRLMYGQWASLVTVSTHAYGSSGKSGSSSTTTTGGTSSNYYDYLNYLNYVNSYYNSYYGGYYGSYYNNYYGGYYGGYYGDYTGSTSTTTSTTTVTTEIPSFEPLIFEFYIEPKE